MTSKKASEKGAEIHFIGGKYARKIGRVNEAKKASTKRVYVIVAMDKGVEKPTYVQEKMLVPILRIPRVMLRQSSSSSHTLKI